jgi:hypothetical protein
MQDIPNFTRFVHAMNALWAEGQKTRSEKPDTYLLMLHSKLDLKATI